MTLDKRRAGNLVRIVRGDVFAGDPWCIGLIVATYTLYEDDPPWHILLILGPDGRLHRRLRTSPLVKPL